MHWAREEPTPAGLCVGLQAAAADDDEDEKGRWTALDCAVANLFVCEKNGVSMFF